MTNIIKYFTFVHINLILYMLKSNLILGLNMFLIHVNVVNFGLDPYKKKFSLDPNIFKNIWLRSL